MSFINGYSKKKSSQVTDDEWSSQFSEITRYLLRKNDSNKPVTIYEARFVLFSSANHCTLSFLSAHSQAGSNEY